MNRFTLVAPLVCVTAIGVHWAMHVPTSEMEPRPDEKETAQKKKKEARKRSKAKDAVRTGPQLERARKEWSSRPFADEPNDKGFGRRARPVLQRARALSVEQALGPTPRTRTLEGSVECRTVRCEVEFCGTRVDVDAAIAAMHTVKLGEQSLWNSPQTVSAPPVAGTAPAAEACTKFTAALSVDDPKRNDVVLPPKG